MLFQMLSQSAEAVDAHVAAGAGDEEVSAAFGVWVKCSGVDLELARLCKPATGTLQSKVDVKCHRLSTTSCVHRGTYSYKVTSTSDKQFSRFHADRQKTERRRQAATDPLTACVQVNTVVVRAFQFAIRFDSVCESIRIDSFC